MPASPQLPDLSLSPIRTQHEAVELPPPAPDEPLAVRGNGFCARSIDGRDPLQAAAFQRLRYGYFVRQRRWVAEDTNCPGHESDCYDVSSFHLGVFKGERLVAYMRTLPWQPGCGFMLEHEFRLLLPEEANFQLVHRNAVELTRLVVAPHTELALRDVPQVSELLFRLFYQVAQRRGWEQLYIVVEPHWLPLFARRFGFRFEPLSHSYTFPDGTRTVAAQARLADLEAGLAEKCPDKLRWYQEP